MTAATSCSRRKNTGKSNFKILCQSSNKSKSLLLPILLSNSINGPHKPTDNCSFVSLMKSMTFTSSRKILEPCRKVSSLLSMPQLTPWEREWMTQTMKLKWRNRPEKEERRYRSDYGESIVRKLKNIGVSILKKVLMSMESGSVLTFWEIQSISMSRRKWKLYDQQARERKMKIKER